MEGAATRICLYSYSCSLHVWDGMGWDGMEWNGMGWDSMGWNWIAWGGWVG